MAQLQYTTYQSDILSYQLRDALVGILKPGRYMGYDLMQEYSPQVGDNVYCEVKNDNGQNKYNGDGVDPPTLEAKRGIAVTTQGTIIADDLTTPLQVTVPLITGGSTSGVFHIVYIEHIYNDSIPGANAATYGIISGSDNATMPVLTSPTKRVIIGIIWEKIGAIQFSDLTWYPAPPEIGDGNILEDLFKIDAQGIRINRGTIPADGIIGDRYFNVAPDYLTNYKSITEALYELDVALKTEETARIAISGRSLDDSNWGAMLNNTNYNVHTGGHGFIPTMPGLADYFFNGNGSWDDIHDYIDTTIWDDTPAIVFNQVAIAASGGVLDFSSLVPSGSSAVILRLYGHYTGTGSQFFTLWKGGFSASSGPGIAAGITTDYSKYVATAQVTIPLSATRTLSWTTGSIAAWSLLDITLLGWVI